MPLVWFSLTPPKDDNGFVRHVCSLQNDVFTNSIFYDRYQFVWYRNQFYWSVVLLFCSLNIFFFLIASHLRLSIFLLSGVVSEISRLAVSYFSFFRMLGLMLPGPWDLLLLILLNCSENLLCWLFNFWVLFRIEPVKNGSGVETLRPLLKRTLMQIIHLAFSPQRCFLEYPICTLIISQPIDFPKSFLFLRNFLLVTFMPVGSCSSKSFFGLPH